jgi:hypothetical protein
MTNTKWVNYYDVILGEVFFLKPAATILPDLFNISNDISERFSGS